MRRKGLENFSNRFRNTFLIINLLLLFCHAKAASQIIPGKKYDYGKIDNYVVNHHTSDGKNNCITVLYSSADCENCILFLRQTLGEIKPDNKIPVYVITDNIAYAKKNLGKYKLNYTYYFDREIFNQFEINKRTLLYSRFNSVLNDNPEQIINLANASATTPEIVFQQQDTVLMANDLETRTMPYNAFATINPKMDVAILFRKTKSADVNKSYSVTYLYKNLRDSLKIYTLQERNPDPENLKLIPFKEFGQLAQKNAINFYKIHSLTSYNNAVYCTFTISRLYKDVRQKDNFSILSNAFIAQKEIKSEKDLLDVMCIDTYDHIYFADMFTYQDTVYPMSTWIYSTPDPTGKNTLLTNVNKVEANGGELSFGGKATILLDPNTQTMKMTALDANAPKVRFRKNTFENGNYTYKLQKVMIDDSKNLGTILLTREATPLK